MTPAALLAVQIGLVTGWLRPSSRRVYLCAVLLIMVGVLITRHKPVWTVIWYLYAQSIRVSERFPALSACGIAVLAGMGIAWCALHARRWATLLVVLYLVAVAACSGLWIARARRCATLKAQVIFPHAPRSTPPVTFFARGDARDDPFAITKGYAILDGTMIVGNRHIGTSSDIYDHAISLRTEHFSPGEIARGVMPLAASTPPTDVRVTHRAIHIRQLLPGTSVLIRLCPSPLGEHITVEPPSAAYAFRQAPACMRIANTCTQCITHLTITPHLPFSPGCSPYPHWCYCYRCC